jgi:hypothetical protein
MTIGSAMAAEVPAGLSGLLELARTQDPAMAAQEVQRRQQALTYMPRSAGGQNALQQVGRGVEGFMNQRGGLMDVSINDAIAHAQTLASEHLSPSMAALGEGALSAIIPPPARPTRKGSQLARLWDEYDLENPVYRGVTPREGTQLLPDNPIASTSMEGDVPRLTYFSDDPEEASNYAMRQKFQRDDAGRAEWVPDPEGGGAVYPVYLKKQTPETQRLADRAIDAHSVRMMDDYPETVARLREQDVPYVAEDVIAATGPESFISAFDPRLRGPELSPVTGIREKARAPMLLGDTPFSSYVEAKKVLESGAPVLVRGHTLGEARGSWGERHVPEGFNSKGGEVYDDYEVVTSPFRLQAIFDLVENDADRLTLRSAPGDVAEKVAAESSLIARAMEDSYQLDMAMRDEIAAAEVASRRDSMRLAPEPPAPEPPARSGRIPYGRSTIRGAERKYRPGIFKSPEELNADAAGMLAPESENMHRLFGVTRQDLSDMSFARTEGDDYARFIPGLKPNPSGTAHASRITKPANTRRLVDALESARGTPLATGMEGWYVMDPAFHRLVELVGEEEAIRRYERINILSGIHSANAAVDKELVRGTGANWLLEQGRMDDYFNWGNSANRLTPDSQGLLRHDRPADMDYFPGHYAHKTAHGKPVKGYLTTGRITSDEPKVPSYIGASGVPETGYQNQFPVGDAHFSRMIGLADVRPNVSGKTDVGKSWSMAEAQELQPWWKGVAEQAGYNPVQGQGVGWGLFGPQTGVKTKIGAPKLEILSDLIMETAKRERISPELARDKVLLGELHAGRITPEMIPYLMGAGALGMGMLAPGGEE